MLVIGAHNGSKLKDNILASKERGPVLLIEPVPYLFSQLRAEFGDVPNVFLLPACISTRSGPQEFFAPRQEANQVAPWGDQLGSLRSDHAARHHDAFKSHVETIEVQGITFGDLIDRFQIKSINVLFTDTEGYDCILLQTFPFLKLRPKKILFEFKHADGTFIVGPNLAHLLLKFDALDYFVRVIDSENMLAISKI